MIASSTPAPKPFTADPEATTLHPMDIIRRHRPDQAPEPSHPVSGLEDSQQPNIDSAHPYGFEAEQSIPDRFRQIVCSFPAHQAVISGEWQPTYEQLDHAANRIAHVILALGGARGDRIAILTRHDSPQMAAVLGVLKANRVVIVMNPSDPQSRLEHILEDATPHLILTDSVNSSLMQKIASDQLKVISIEPYLRDELSDDPALVIDPFDVAFLVYTSGSTGHPKGIMQSHRNILHNASRLSKGLLITKDDRILMAASLSGAHGMATMACTLMNGAQLSLYPAMERGVSGLDTWVNQQCISLFVASASLFRYFAKSLDSGMYFPTVRMVRLGSEAVGMDDFTSFQKHFPEHAVLFHTLSSSETGNITQSQYRHDYQPTGKRLPVGYPADGIEIKLLNEHGTEVSAGETGEIIVRSRYLSHGYWRNDELTESRFTTIDAATHLRQYRTGDLGRLNQHGELIFLGRKDSQVKIHGYRIELSEVEDALLQLPGVNKAVVYAIDQGAGDQLVASVVLREGQTSTTSDLRDALRQTLPNYMIPTSLSFVDDFPLTPHGKIDHQRLRQDHIAESTQQEEEAPLAASETEAILLRIWGEEFQGQAIARHSNFFDLGGDSLHAAIIMARIEKLCHIELDLRLFLIHPRLHEFASEIDRLKGQQGSSATPIVRVPRDGDIPLSYIQERVWKLERHVKGPTGNTMAFSHRISGHLRVDALIRCLQELNRRHEILRTSFTLKHGEPVQVIHPYEPVSIPVIDGTGFSDVKQFVDDILQKEALVPFDLSRSPLLRIILVKISDHEHWLLRINHHIISDGWSWTIYFRELGVLYEACINGKPFPPFDEQTLQFADYAAWQRQIIRPEHPSYANAIDWGIQQFSDHARPTVPPVKRWIRHPFAKAKAGTLKWGIDQAIVRKLKTFGNATGASFHSIRLAAFAALLAYETGQSDIILGNYVTNRTRTETRNIFGFLINQLPTKLSVNPSLTFHKWIDTVQQKIAETHAQGDIPSDLLRQELAKHKIRLPEVATIFSVRDNAETIRFADLEISWENQKMEVMPWGFTFSVNMHRETYASYVRFDSRIYHPKNVRRFVVRYVALLKLLSEYPDTPMAELLQSFHPDDRSRSLVTIADDT